MILIKIDIDQFSHEIEKELEVLVNETSKKMEKVIVKTGKAGAKELRKTAPINRYHKTNRGRYRSGWRSKRLKGKFGNVEMVVYNKTDWQLTHLLENGFYHVKSNKQVKPHPHIEPVQKRMESNVIRDLKKELSL